MIHLISLKIVWLLFGLWQNMVCHFVEPNLWLHKMGDRVALVVFAVTTGWTTVISRLYSYNLVCFIWTLSLHEDERLNRIHEMLQNCMYSYFEIVLSFNFITLNSFGVTASWIYYVFFHPTYNICLLSTSFTNYLRLICSNKMSTAYKR